MGGPGSGRRCKSVAEHVASGTFRRDPQGDYPPVHPPGRPKPPKVLNKLELGVWAAFMTVAWPRRRKFPPSNYLADPACVGQFAVLWALAQRARSGPRADGLFELAMRFAPCDLEQRATRRFIKLAAQAYDRLYGESNGPG